MTEDQISKRYGPIVAVVNSRSDPAKMYNVRRSSSGMLSCNCKGWVFNRGIPRRCCHTDAVGVSVKDAATVICEELLQAIDMRLPVGRMQKMADTLRPHLSVNVSVSIQQPTQTTGGLISAGRRLITLED